MNTSLFTWGIILVVVGLLGSLYFYSQNKDCGTAIQDIAKAVGAQSSHCSTVEILMYAFIVVGVVGIILLTVGAAKGRT